jgi:hypothetical protein
LEPLDPLLSRDTYLDALSAALFVGRLAVRWACRRWPRPRVPRRRPRAPVRPQDLLLDGLAVVITEGYVAGAPLLKEAVSAFRTTDIPVVEAMRWLWPTTHAAYDLWDDESWDELSAHRVTLARETGAPSVLPIALRARVGFHLLLAS